MLFNIIDLRATARTVGFLRFGEEFHYGIRGCNLGAALFQSIGIFRISMRSKEVGTSQAPPAADEAQASEWQAPRERNRKGSANGWSQQDYFLSRWTESHDAAELQYPFGYAVSHDAAKSHYPFG